MPRIAVITGLRAGLHCGPLPVVIGGEDMTVITGLRAGLHCGEIGYLNDDSENPGDHRPPGRSPLRRRA